MVIVPAPFWPTSKVTTASTRHAARVIIAKTPSIARK